MKIKNLIYVNVSKTFKWGGKTLRRHFPSKNITWLMEFFTCSYTNLHHHSFYFKKSFTWEQRRNITAASYLTAAARQSWASCQRRQTATCWVLLPCLCKLHQQNLKLFLFNFLILLSVLNYLHLTSFSKRS